MLDPLDTTTDPNAATMRRLQALEDQVANFEAQTGSRYSFFNGTTPQVEAIIAAHENDPVGTMLMIRHEYGEEFEFKIQGEIFVKFPEGWYTI